MSILSVQRLLNQHGSFIKANRQHNNTLTCSFTTITAPSTMVQYSSLFASGLMAPRTRNYRAYSPDPSSAPNATAPSTSETGLQKPPKIYINTQTTPSRQRLRKRRSSLTTATSPISTIKSPSKSAGISFSRALLMSPSKSRDLYDVDEFSQNYERQIPSAGIGRIMR